MTQEVWLVWSQEPWCDPELMGIYSTEEIAEKHKKQFEDTEIQYKLTKWRENNNKHPTEFPDFDIKTYGEYYTNSWMVSTE